MSAEKPSGHISVSRGVHPIESRQGLPPRPHALVGPEKDLETAGDIPRQAGDQAMAARALCNIGDIMLSRGDQVRARGVLEAALGFGVAHTSSEQAVVKDAVAAARKRLGPDAFETAHREGRAMTADEAVALALGRSAPARVERSHRPGGLTGREAQIVRDIARGLTNRQIAEKLGISGRTVDAHVQNVRNKLGMEKRAQIAAWASSHLPERTPI